MKFELISGRHSNSSGNFKPGDIIDSAGDLEKAFKLKFRRRLDLEYRDEPARGGKTVKGAKVINVAPDPVLTPAEEAHKAASATKDGQAATGIETPEQAAGEPVGDAARAAALREANPPVVPPGAVATSPAAAAEPVAPAAGAFGKNVTKEFPSAKGTNMQVFHNAKGFFVVDTTEPTESINEKPLKDAAAVTKLITKLTQ